MMSEVVAKRIVDRVACFLPWPRQPRTCFFNLRPGGGGPGTFSRKLTGEFRKQGIATTYRRLRSAQAALLFSVSWGDWFYRLCQRWSVRTVLRVDGFLVPSYFDNRPQPPGFQDRRLTLKKMATNYRMQRDLLLADFVIYQSAFCKQIADQLLYNRRDRYAVVFNGVDLEQFRPGPPRSGRLRLLSAGSLRDEYMLGSVLPVFERLWQPYDLELLIVGSLEPICQQQIKEFAQAHPVAAERIQVVGPVANDDLPAYMQQADLLVHPRLGDNCPNIVIEAMACGLPVVCGSWGGTAELVGDGGVIVPTGEWTYGEEFVVGLSKATETILAHLDTYRCRARQRAEKTFDIKQVAKIYADYMGIETN